MTTLGELARLIRSKNAGPFTLTFDIMFDTIEDYCRVVQAKAVTPEIFARLYGVPAADVLFVLHDAASAIKISIPRPYIQCDPGDGDAYGGQQHAPLVELEVAD